MRLVRLSWLAVILAVAVIELSCGDTFRPIAIPQNPNPPDPQNLGFTLVLSTNGPDVCSPPSGTCDTQPHPGGSSRIDVTGDTNIGTATVGLFPVHAALIPGASQAFVANRMEDTISSYATATPTTVTTISLPSGSAPVYVHTTESGTVYSANSGTNTVSVISVARNVVTKTIGVGVNPVALAETPDGKKLYVVNQGDGVGNGTVTVITTVDENAVTTLTAEVKPVWAAARFDNAFVYVLNQGSGTLSVINTVTDAPPVSVAVPNANYAYYDPKFNRIYLTTSDNKVLTLDAGSDVPTVSSNVDLSSSCAGGCVLDSITALLDGSRVYVASHTASNTCSQAGVTSCIATNIFVLRSPTNNLLKTITTGAQSDIPAVDFCNTISVRRHIAASIDSSRIFIANCDAGGTDIIRTSDDTFVLNLPAPVSSLPPIAGQTFPPPERPIFVLPGR